jgi:hypothetical protein
VFAVAKEHAHIAADLAGELPGLSEGHWRLITPSAESQNPMQLTRIP